MEPKSILISLLVLALGVPAGAEPLKVKAGLWETTTTTERRGAKQPVNLDKLPPDQRARVEQKLAERVRKETRTVRACLSDVQIASGEAFLGRSHQTSCTRTFETRTASDLVANLACTGVNKMAGRVEMHAVDQEHMTGTVDMMYGASDSLQLMTRSDITARRLGSDCSTATMTADSSRRH